MSSIEFNSHVTHCGYVYTQIKVHDVLVFWGDVKMISNGVHALRNSPFHSQSLWICRNNRNALKSTRGI